MIGWKRAFALLCLTAGLGGCPLPGLLTRPDIVPAGPSSSDIAQAVFNAQQHRLTAQLEAIERSRPSSEEILLRIGLATALLEENEFTAAREHTDWLVVIQPESWIVWQQWARVRLFAERDLHGALAGAERCLELMATASGCMRVQGLALLELGQEQQARASLEAALQTLPRDAQLIEQVARLRMAQGEPDSALQLLWRAIGQGIDGTTIRLVAGSAAENAGQLEDARTHYEWVMENHREPVLGARYMLLFLQRQGFTNEAAALSRRIYGSSSGRSTARQTR
jgi:tetratricopeptide (TPR) repeat protein